MLRSLLLFGLVLLGVLPAAAQEIAEPQSLTTATVPVLTSAVTSYTLSAVGINRNSPGVLRVTVHTDGSNVDKVNIILSDSPTITAVGTSVAQTGLVIEDGQYVDIRTTKKYLFLRAYGSSAAQVTVARIR